MTKKLRIATFSILGILLLFVAFAFLSTRNTPTPNTPSPTPTPTTIEEKNKATLTINNGSGSKTYTYEFTGERTVFDALKDIAEVENIDLVTEQYNFGVFIKSLDGYENDQYSAWVYTVNGESVMVGADQKMINDKDAIEWKYVSE
jgi:hypothetical protein